MLVCLLGRRGSGHGNPRQEWRQGTCVAWAIRKARRVGGRLDDEADQVIDAGLDRLHEVVATRLAGHPVLAELVEEAEQAGEISELTRQQVELAVAAAARKDEVFGHTVMELVGRLREAELARGPVAAGPGCRRYSPATRTRRPGTEESRSARQPTYIWADSLRTLPRPGRSGH